MVAASHDVERVAAMPAKVLIVDDSAPSLKLMRYELEKAGFRVLTASSGREGLSLARCERPDLILLDVLMPEMDGFEACRRLKACPELCSTPVLMWTALDSTGDIVRGLEAGAQDYVTKPFVPAVLRARIDAALRAKRAHDALRKSNEALERSQRAAHQALDVRNEFLSHVSHELRTPLTSVHQFLSILLDGLAGGLNEEQREYLEIAFRNAKQLRSMIGDLMDVTRLQNGKLRVTPRPLDLGGAVGDLVRGQLGLAEARGLELAHQLEPIPEVLADEVRVRQVLSNLVENAIKFTPEGGRIDVHAGRDPERPGFVRVSVRDTGCGVDPSARERIFRYMQQEEDDDWRSRKGLGIGLYICRELVTRQGGRIWVEAAEGKGSTFCFTVPEFDLEALLSPALLEEGRMRSSFSLLRIDLEPLAEPVTYCLPEALSRRAYHLVRSCLLDCDVLLPRFFSGDLEETYFVVAGTGEEGLESLRRRIETSLVREAGIDEQEFRIRVRGRIEKARTDGAGEPQAAVRAVCRSIQELTRGGWDD